MSNNFARDRILNILISLLSVITLATALTGLFFPVIYQGRLNLISLPELAGQDTISTAIALILLLRMALPSRKNTLSRITTGGLLLYILYVYGYMLFTFTSIPMTLVYMIISGLTLFSLIFLISGCRGSVSQLCTENHYPRRSISVFFFIITGLVAVMEIRDLVTHTLFSTEGIPIKQSFVYLDLCFLFPAMIMAGIWNWKKQSWGVLLTGMFLIKTVTLMPAIALSDVYYYIDTGSFLDSGFDILAAVITLISALFLVLYYRNISFSQVISQNEV